MYFTGIAKNEEDGVETSLQVTGAISIFWMIAWIAEVLYFNCIRVKTRQEEVS